MKGSNKTMTEQIMDLLESESSALSGGMMELIHQLKEAKTLGDYRAIASHTSWECLSAVAEDAQFVYDMYTKGLVCGSTSKGGHVLKTFRAMPGARTGHHRRAVG